MSAIWKYPIPVQDGFSLIMPKGAKPLAVQCQYGEPQLWALVDPEAELVEHGFRLAGTGHILEATIWQYTYIGTFQLADGNLIFHIFYKGEK